MIKHKDHFLAWCKFEVGNGKDVRFWEDWWIGDKTLKHSFPRLYGLCFDKNKSIAEVFRKGLASLSFRRTLYGDSLELWGHVREACEGVMLNQDRDRIKWSLNKNGIYTVKSYYRHLTENGVKYPHNFMWKTKIPPRVRVFMWLVLRNNILTRDNSLRRG